jgi:hypothetical protein
MRRLSDLRSAGLLLLIMVALYLVTATVMGLYHGNQDIKGRPTTPGTATVGACDRAGPVSRYGLGYVWNCDVTVRLADGRTVTTKVEHSEVTPSDRNQPVPFVEVCSSRSPGKGDCYYWRPGNRLIAVLTRLLDFAVVATLVALGGMFYVLVLRALLGRRWYGRIFRKRHPTRWVGAEAMDEINEGEEPPADAGLLRVGFRYRSSSSALLDTSAPTLVLDGVEVPTLGWSVQTVRLPPGRHRLEVRLPFGTLKTIRGAHRDITVVAGQQLGVTYDAPDTPGAPGSLRVADEPYLDIATGRALLATVLLVGATYLLLRPLL